VRPKERTVKGAPKVNQGARSTGWGKKKPASKKGRRVKNKGKIGSLFDVRVTKQNEEGPLGGPWSSLGLEQTTMETERNQFN